MINLDILRQFPLFQVRRYDKDEYYIIQEGMVKISRNQQAREIILSIFQTGDFFGEMSLLEESKKWIRGDSFRL